MLKSTHKPLDRAELPEGWTEHKAPTGHPYFYNSATKESTYIRPQSIASLQPTPASITPPFVHARHDWSNSRQGHVTSDQTAPRQGARDNGADGPGGYGRRRTQAQDRPRSMHPVPGCDNWVLVKTKLGRRFVHNLMDNESFWRYPHDVMKGVIEYDRLEREKVARQQSHAVPAETQERPTATEVVLEVSTESGPTAAPRPTGSTQETPTALVDSEGEEYEEVEVTDDEDEDNPSKRQRTEDGEADETVEFNEDDIAYQLAQMGDDYGLDPEEYGDGGDADDAAQGLPLTDEDASALFKDMLDDHRISPYVMWEKLVEAGQIIEDDRYTVLPNMKSRKEVWGEWSREKIQHLKEQRAKEEKIDPKIPYFAFLELKATPKLYWPEFRRKYQKEPLMKATGLIDKEREKWYREYISRLKLPESTLKTDLISLLRDQPLQVLNRDSTVDALPTALRSDLRYISLRASVRDPLIEAHISCLPVAPTQTSRSGEEDVIQIQVRQDRRRREEALAERQKMVAAQKREQQGALHQSKRLLREEEDEVQQAMKVGKEGLKGYIDQASL